ncbi:hypothetical protein MTO96_027579 [Rhipicephalus appendiculatus]
MGYATAKALTSRGARVIFSCRDMQVTLLAIIAMIEASGGGDIALKQLDLFPLASMRRLANGILETEPRLDLKTTIRIGLARLTGVLLELLKHLALSPIIVVSSMVHAWVHLDPDDSFLEQHYTHSRAYDLSKLYNVCFRPRAGRQAARRTGHRQRVPSGPG